MEDIDKATTTIPDSPAQKLLKKVDRRDKLIRTVELTFLFIALLFNVFIAIKSVQTQQQIQQNQDANIARSQQRSKNLQNYLTCVLSLPISSRDKVALQGCQTATDSLK